MADEEEKKEDKGEHINLKVKDQVPFFVARSFFSRAKERERENSLLFVHFILVVVFLKMKRTEEEEEATTYVLVEHD